VAYIPVDYDPDFGDGRFGDPNQPSPLPSPPLPRAADPTGVWGDPEAVGLANLSTAIAPVLGGAGRAIAGDIGDIASGIWNSLSIPAYLEQENRLLGRTTETGLPDMTPAQAAQFALMHVAGAAPAGTLSAGLRRGPGGRVPLPGELPGDPLAELGPPPGMGHNQPPEGIVPPSRAPVPQTSEAPFDVVANGENLGDRLRSEHLARGDDALPLSGARMPVTPPPHIQSSGDVAGLVNRYADLAQEGEAAKNWYLESGRAIANASNDLETAGKFTSAIARTSPQTDVAANLTHAITLHNQAMVGDPLSAGRFPAAMGADVERYYYGNDPVTGEKIAPFHNALDVGWNADFPHTYVNDVWNMRAMEYPGKGGDLYDSTPTLGQHNFTRIIADQALDEIERRTGQRWDPRELQAATWAAIKSREENLPLSQTAMNYANGLERNMAQASWEAAPGLTSGHLPEFHTAPMADRQAFHDDIRSVLVDPQGNDIIHRHLGLLTGQSFDAPGYFRSNVAPGTQAPAAVGQAPGGYKLGVDPASRDLMNAGEAVRGLLLRQDAFSWLKPSYSAGLANKDLSQANMADMRIGRPLTMDEAANVGNKMQELTGSDFFSPIATRQGYRLYNVPGVTGLTNRDFWGKVRELAASDLHPDADIVNARADGNYVENDWSKGSEAGGQNFIGEIRRTGRPDVQRATAELLATLGPRVQQVEERWAQTHGWTPNRASRIWDNPIIQGYAGAVVPNPPRPWVQRPAPRSSGPPLFSVVPGGAIPSNPAQAPQPPPNLIPVDHDPFAGEPPAFFMPGR
jgi:hypothetical protein